MFDRLGMLFVVFVESLLWQSWDSRETLDVSGSHQQNLGTGLVIWIHLVPSWDAVSVACSGESVLSKAAAASTEKHGNLV